MDRLRRGFDGSRRVLDRLKRKQMDQELGLINQGRTGNNKKGVERSKMNSKDQRWT